MNADTLVRPALWPVRRWATAAGPGRSERTALVLECVALVVGTAFLVWCSRRLFFVQDEWDFLQVRLTNANASIFLVAHNQHIPVLAVALYKLIYASFGLHHYGPYQLPHVVGQLIGWILLFAVVRRRLGAMVGFFAVLPVVFLGSAWETLLLPFNGTLVYPTVCLLAVLLLLDRSDRWVDPAICGLLVLAVSSAEFGAIASLGLLARFLYAREIRRLWVPVVPLVLYGLWYVNYGLHAAHQPGYAITAHPRYLLDLITGSLGGLLGLPLGIQQVGGRSSLVLALHVLTVGLLVGLGWGLITRRRRLTPDLVMVITITGVWWIVLTLTRGYMHQPYVSHYLYVSAILIVLLGAEYFRDRPLGVAARRALVAVSCIATALNAAVLVHYSNSQRHTAAVISAEVGALQLADPARLPPDFQMDSNVNRAPEVTAGLYVAMVERLHQTPAPSAASIEAEPEYARAAADGVLVRAARVSPVPLTPQVRRLLSTTSAPPPLAGFDTADGASAVRSGRCLRMTPVAGRPATYSVTLPRIGLIIESLGGASAIRLRLFAHRFDEPPVASVTGSELIPTPRDPIASPWHAQLRSDVATMLCPA